MKKILLQLSLAFVLSVLAAFVAISKATQPPKFTLAWSHYTGWEFWGYAHDKGIIDRWAKKYGIRVDVKLMDSYIESINLFTAGKFDAVTATNLDALIMPVVGGVNTEAIIVGDFSNGNDGLVAKKAASVNDLKGREVNTVEYSVSHFLLARALEEHGLTEQSVRVKNAEEGLMYSIFQSQPDAVVTSWNPMLQRIINVKGGKLLFDSSHIPGEIVDATFVRADVDERFKKALTGAWYETMAAFQKDAQQRQAMIKHMAASASATPAEFKAQLRTTEMFYRADEAQQFTESVTFAEAMQDVRHFCFQHGLYTNRIQGVDDIGIKIGERVLGNPDRVKLTFNSDYMALAAEKKL